MYVIRKKGTHEVYSVAEKNDTVIPESYELVTTPGLMEDLVSPVHPNLCTFDKDIFTINQVAVDADEKLKVKNMIEDKISKEKDSIVRKQAVVNLMRAGELPIDYKDKEQ